MHGHLRILKRQRIVLFFTAAFFLLFGLFSPAMAEKNTLLIIDASGSMRSSIDGMVKMDMAKDVLCDYISRLPRDMNVGLVAYGHRSKDDCSDVEYMVPLGKNNRDLMIEKIISMKPMGKTPISLSLEKAVAILDTVSGDNTIILVSDGKESCNAEPCALLERYAAQGKSFVAHVVGFDVGVREKKELECIAAAGRGKYYPADNLKGFKIALENVAKDQPPVIAPVEPAVVPMASGVLSLPKTAYVAGERIWLHFDTVENYEPKAWVGIVPADVPHGSEKINDQHDLSYKYLNRMKSGDFEFFAPGQPGRYDFRLNDSDNNGREVAHVTFEVIRGSATLSMPKNSLVSGEPFTVTVNPLSYLCPKAWVGVVPSDIPHGDEERNDKFDLSYKYLGDKPNGTFAFNAPTKPGNYDMRLHDTDNKGSEIASISFTVGQASGGLSLPRTVYQAGEKIVVSFSTAAKLDKKAWVGMIPSDIPHGSEARNDQHDLAYHYLDGQQTGSFEFVAPSKSGSYDFRLNDSDNNGNELDSISFTVVDSSASLSLDKPVYAPGERMWVTFKTSVAFASKAWVGIIPSNVPHGREEVNDDHDISYVYVDGETEGVREMEAPTVPGTYDVRFNDTDDNGKEIASVTFTVR